MKGTAPESRPRVGMERAARSVPAGLLLVSLLLAVYVPGLFSIPTVDRDEARFAQASRQMFESLAGPEDARDTRPIGRTPAGAVSGGLHAGGWAVPMFGERPRLSKPPLIYWVQSASAALLTGLDPLADRIWHYRLPSVLSAVGACLITWRLGVGMGHARAGWLAAALLGVSPMVVWDAHQARADQLLLFCTTAAMGALMSLRIGPPTARPRFGMPVVFWAAVGAGILTKGPITPMIAALAGVTVSWTSQDWRWLRRTRPLLGVVILALMLAPWVVASACIVGWDTLTSVWLDETIGRSAEPREGHWGPPGYHLVLLAVLFWPGSLVTLHAVRRACGRAVQLPKDSSFLVRWRGRGKGGGVSDDAGLFLLAWAVPAWLVFELVGTKLPHYTLPLYPAVALLTARVVLDLADRVHVAHKPVPPRSGLAVWVVIGVVLTAAAPIAIARLDGSVGLLAIAAGGAAASIGLIAWAATSVRASILRTHALAIAATVVFASVLLGAVLPRARPLHVTDRLSELIRLAPPDAPVAATGYHEDSLTFATRARVVRLSPDRVMEWADQNPGGVLILSASATSPTRPAWIELGRVSGINYSKGERVELTVYQIE